MLDIDIHGAIRATTHRGGDDLLSAGLGLRGLSGTLAPFMDSQSPTPAELRRRAIQSSWKGIADLGRKGGFGSVYGAVPDVPGREYTAFARLTGACAPHRVLLQVPDGFDRKRRCLVVTASSGSRGIYGAIALAGGWGLPRGCAVAYTDKGGGAGYFDTADGTGVALDGMRRQEGDALLEFEPVDTPRDAGIAVKHAHSGDHPEADWGRHVLQAAHFGLAMLDEAFPEDAPFTPANTTIIATGLSNGGGAVLRAAGDDAEGLLDAVVALEPNIHVDGGRPFFDYGTEAGLWLPAAMASSRFDELPFARVGMAQPPAWGCGRPRCVPMDACLVSCRQGGGDEALDHLLAQGWREESFVAAASSTALDLWRVIAAPYASAYLRRSVGDMPLGFAYRAPPGLPGEAAIRAAWWSGAGLPPGPGIVMEGGTDLSMDPLLPGQMALSDLWAREGGDGAVLREAVGATAAAMPREGLPVVVVHGAADGLIPAVFASDPYVRWLRAEGRAPVYWRVPHAQHFDAFLSFPEFGDLFVPLLPYGYAALDRVWAHLAQGRALPEDAAVRDARPRGPGMLTADALGLSLS